MKKSLIYRFHTILIRVSIVPEGKFQPSLDALHFARLCVKIKGEIAIRDIDIGTKFPYDHYITRFLSFLNKCLSRPSLLNFSNLRSHPSSSHALTTYPLFNFVPSRVTPKR